MPGLLTALAMLAAPAPSAPPPSPSAETDAIVVTGTRETKEQVRGFIKGITVETDEQIAVFADNVCPFAVGLPPAHNAVVVNRIRAVAAEAGIPVAREDCRPNLTVIVAAGGRGFIKHLRKERPALFPYFTRREREALEQGPVRAWQTIEHHRTDGGPVERIAFFDGRLVARDAYLVSDVANSRIQQPVRHDLSRSFVVFDLEAIEGLGLAQLADYAAMRTLARTKPGAGSGGRSILALFDDRDSGAAPADGLTSWDAAYLKALYATSNSLAASQQRKNIGTAVTKALAAEGGGD